MRLAFKYSIENIYNYIYIYIFTYISILNSPYVLHTNAVIEYIAEVKKYILIKLNK